MTKRLTGEELAQIAELKVGTTEAEELKALAHEIRQIRREIRRDLAIDDEIPSYE